MKEALENKDTVFGLYIAVPSPIMVEIAGYAGFDFIRIDMSHGVFDMPTVLNMIRAAEASGVIPTVRIDYDPVLIANVLEAGVKGIFIPDVSTVEMAKSVVDTVYFHPKGGRGTFSASRICRYGAVDGGDYAKWSNDEVILGIQIESKEAIDNLDKIIDIDGIDMIGSGRGDLANAIGLIGQKNHPSVLALEERIFDAAIEGGKFVSVNLDPTDENFSEVVSKWKSKAHVITLGHDINIVRKNFVKSIVTARQS
ncbi:MAG: aldolase/citrate lyase family protein [Gammaproteobacteria bacterium]|nr:aldolase/citrate lyase family protein [Gammaproteobacteria bacterium]